MLVGGEEVGSGRLVLLHDPAGNAAWQGTFRCVTFARAEVDPEMVTDPLLASVGWSWLIDALAGHGAEYLAPSGTVTSVSSESFGGMAEEAPAGRGRGPGVLDARCWTDGVGLTAHLAAWAELLCTTAGLPPLPAGVVLMPSRRNPPSRIAETLTDAPLPDPPVDDEAGPAHRAGRRRAAGGGHARAARRRPSRRWRRGPGRSRWTPSGRTASATASGPT